MTTRKNILYIDATPILAERISGIGHVVLETIRALLLHHPEYEVRLLVPINKTSELNRWGLDGVKIVRIPLPARVWNYIPRIPIKVPIDIFMKKGTYIFMNFKTWSVLKSKSVTYIHDISFKLFPQFTESRNLASLSEGVNRWIAKTDLVVTDSTSSKNEIIEQYPIDRDKVSVVYCGVDKDTFKKIPDEEINTIKMKYGLDGQYLMFLSSLEPRKNIERLLDSLNYLPQTMKNEVSLLLVGGMGWQNEPIYKKIDEMRAKGWNIVKPSSYVPDADIPVLLSGASMLVHPALHEGFGMPAVEAMACGTPVITSDIPVMREVCQAAAIYVDPLNTEGIGAAIVDLYKNSKLRASLIKAGTKQSGMYTWKRAANDLIEAVERIEKKV